MTKASTLGKGGGVGEGGSPNNTDTWDAYTGRGSSFEAGTASSISAREADGIGSTVSTSGLPRP